MKSMFSLRFLCIVSFMLLICPFYDSCNGHGMKRVEETAVEAPNETQNSATDVSSKIEIKATEKTEVEKPKSNFLESFIDFIDDGDSQNAIEIGAMSWIIFTCGLECQINGLKSSIAQNDYNEIFFGTTNACFALIVVFTFLNLIFVFTRKINLVARFSKWIMILLVIASICIVNEKQFKEISQIKWGFYSFIVVNGLIYNYSNRLNKVEVS